MRYATDPDHAIARTTIANRGRKETRAALTGAFWVPPYAYNFFGGLITPQVFTPRYAVELTSTGPLNVAPFTTLSRSAVYVRTKY